MENPTLYELTQDYQNLMAMADDPEIDDQIFKDTLEGLEGAIEDKADGYASVIRNLEVNVGALDGRIQAIERELDRVKDHKKSLENRIAYMKETLCTAMIACDKKKFHTSKFNFWVQKSTPAVVIDNEADVSFEYFDIPEPRISKAKIKDALTKGEVLSFAHLEQKDGVRFR